MEFILFECDWVGFEDGEMWVVMIFKEFMLGNLWDENIWVGEVVGNGLSGVGLRLSDWLEYLESYVVCGNWSCDR